VAAGERRDCNENGCAERLADGTLLEWGSGTTVNGAASLSFPVAFVSGGPHVTVSEGAAGTWNSDNVTIYGVQAATCCQLVVYSMNWTGTQFLSNTTGRVGLFNWFATGS
jgi:hypothetical protein